MSTKNNLFFDEIKYEQKSSAIFLLYTCISWLYLSVVYDCGIHILTVPVWNIWCLCVDNICLSLQYHDPQHRPSLAGPWIRTYVSTISFWLLYMCIDRSPHNDELCPLHPCSSDIHLIQNLSLSFPLQILEKNNHTYCRLFEIPIWLNNFVEIFYHDTKR